MFEYEQICLFFFIVCFKTEISASSNITLDQLETGSSRTLIRVFLAYWFLKRHIFMNVKEERLRPPVIYDKIKSLCGRIFPAYFLSERRFI